ncbi:MAG: DUF2828 family protein [Candidatus Pacearchaeota archaeon]
MANALLQSMTTNDARTANGMLTNSTTSSYCVDLFFAIGAMRANRDNKVMMEKLSDMFDGAFAENPLVAMKILFWSRDIRGGAGEREVFKKLLNHLATKNVEVLLKNLTVIPEYGRFDDLFAVFSTPAERAAIDYIIAVLLGDNNMKPLCAKWMPRLGGKISKDKKLIANKIRTAMGISPKDYRVLLSTLTNVVETAMCNKDFSSIDYQKVPSLAMSRYMKSFGKNDQERFSAYVKAVEKGEAKINAGAIYPYDVIKTVSTNENAAQAQWNALPNFLEGNNENIISMIDVSESMTSSSGKITDNLYAGDVAISLSMYIAERTEGAFKDHFITFTSQPTLQRMTGSLSQRIRQIKGPKGYDTNLSAAFELILNAAVNGNVPVSEMPTKILIVSDMEFNGSYIRGVDASAWQMISQKYEAAGYTMPTIVFWKVNVIKMENNPVKFDKTGAALISGFSPAILKSVLGGDILSPERVMLRTINDPRYSKIII